MRHTLLPLHERKALRRDYSIRLAVILFFLLSFVGVVGIGSLFPAYIHALGEERNARSVALQLQRTKDESGRTAIERELRTDTQLLTRILAGDARIRPSSVVEGIVALREGVDLTSFSVVSSGTTTVTVTLQGNAVTRDELLAFKARLEKTLPGSQVDLPVSELARSKDISFSMRVSYQVL